MIKVLRLMQYTFKDEAEMEASMALWAVPPNGTKQFGVGDAKKHIVVRSSVLISTGFEVDSDD